MLKKHLILVQKTGYGFGGTPLPPFTDKIRKVVFDSAPKLLTNFANLLPLYALQPLPLVPNTLYVDFLLFKWAKIFNFPNKMDILNLEMQNLNLAILYLPKFVLSEESLPQ